MGVLRMLDLESGLSQNPVLTSGCTISGFQLLTAAVGPTNEPDS